MSNVPEQHRDSPAFPTRKALSIWQPWASLLVAGIKTYETRSWPTHHRGLLLIHAGKQWGRPQAEALADPLLRQALRRLWDMDASAEHDPARLFAADHEPAHLAYAAALPRGCIVGWVEVVDCTPADDERSKLPADAALMEQRLGDWGPGRHVIRCVSPRRLRQPVRCAGMQGIFNVPVDLQRSTETP